jgi:phosphoenolpyruvate carboxylase
MLYEEKFLQSHLTSSAVVNKTESDYFYLLDCFREVLKSLDGEEIAKNLANSSGIAPDARFLAGWMQASTISFHLLNIAEGNALLQGLRRQEDQLGFASDYGLFGHQLKRLVERGLDSQTIASSLGEVQVEIVLTAHPTEAKRNTVLGHHRDLYLLLLERENSMYSKSERKGLHERILALLEILWRTGEIRLERPTVADEIDGVLHYLQRVFPSALRRVHNNFRLAWTEMGHDPVLIRCPTTLPKLSFGSWVGGDRDGHPFVTAEVTEQALCRLRGTSLNVIRERLLFLVGRLSISQLLQDVPQILRSRIDLISRKLGNEGELIVTRNKDEPWRQLLGLMLRMLPVEPQRVPYSDHEINDETRYRDPKELEDDLMILHKALGEINANRIAVGDVGDAVALVRSYGFHGACLDVRQNSETHEKVLCELLQAAGFEDWNYASWNEERRMEFLLKELQQKRPFLNPVQKIGEAAEELISCFRVLQRAISAWGASCVHSLIVSMTRQTSDLLLVYSFAREVGLLEEGPEGLYSKIPVSPLFETLDDLERAPKILELFLAHPITQNTIKHSIWQSQEVMVGYSDSCKDAGILASQWAVHNAQMRLSEVCQQQEVQAVFFHGRGGTVSRGAGPTHRFVNALPRNSMHGRFRLTEQGETIAQKYANLGSATYNLENLAACAAGIGLSNKKTKRPLMRDFDDAMKSLCHISADKYRQFISHEHFMSYFRHATPIDALEQGKIGSRPPRRKNAATLSDLRAIPWVFSWSQSRHFIPGWYGVGSAFQELKSTKQDTFVALKDSLQQVNWPFLRYVILNMAKVLENVDLEIISWYASLVPDKQAQSSIMNLIQNEWSLTSSLVHELLGPQSSEDNARRQRSLNLRYETLKPIHQQQVRLLSQWRQAEGAAKDEALLLVALSINAIASGLKSTG